MSSIGINVRRDGAHSPSLIRSFGNTWIRIVALPEYDMRGYLQSCRAAGLKILLVLARESGGDYLRYWNLYGHMVDAIQVGNEPDLSSPSSWTMSQQELAALGRSARAMFPLVPIVTAGLASGHPSWLEGMDLSWADAVAFHPYMKDAPNPSDIEDQTDVTELLAGYAAYGKPLLITEWGWPSDQMPRAAEEVSDMIAWAARTDLVEVFFHFCLSDDMVPPFGLLKPNMVEKPQGKAFKQQAAFAIHSLWPDVQEPEPVDYREYAREAARKAGIPPLLFERQIQQESGFDPYAHNDQSGAHGIAQIIAKFHPNVDPSDPLDSLDYAAHWMAQLWHQYGSYAKALAAYNWGPGNVAGWNGQPGTLPAETRHYLDVVLGAGWPEPGAVGTVTYNPLEPAHPQEESFDCSQESLEWALWAYGRRTSDDWLETTMIAEGVMSVSQGLLDASGAGLAAFIRRHYAELGYDSNHEDPISFDALAAEIGPYPMLIGGRAWNHWSGLRAYNRTRDVLMLANPAEGHKGVHQEMTRAQFSALGPFSMVRVLHKDVLDPPAPEPPPVDPTAERVKVLSKEIKVRADELVVLVGA